MPSEILSVEDVCRELGIKARKLKVAIYYGVLEKADHPHKTAALSGFTREWLAEAKPVVSTKDFRDL